MSSSSNVPNLAIPLLDKGGRLTPVWAQFFLSLFVRSGGAPGVLAGDLQAMAESGTPHVDLAPVYALIHAVEAMAAQAMANGSLLDRIAELEARVEAMGAPAPVPAGYALVRIAGVTRQIPYY